MFAHSKDVRRDQKSGSIRTPASAPLGYQGAAIAVPQVAVSPKNTVILANSPVSKKIQLSHGLIKLAMSVVVEKNINEERFICFMAAYKKECPTITGKNLQPFGFDKKLPLDSHVRKVFHFLHYYKLYTELMVKSALENINESALALDIYGGGIRSHAESAPALLHSLFANPELTQRLHPIWLMLRDELKNFQNLSVLTVRQSSLGVLGEILGCFGKGALDQAAFDIILIQDNDVLENVKGILKQIKCTRNTFVDYRNSPVYLLSKAENINVFFDKFPESGEALFFYHRIHFALQLEENFKACILNSQYLKHIKTIYGSYIIDRHNYQNLFSCLCHHAKHAPEINNLLRFIKEYTSINIDEARLTQIFKNAASVGLINEMMGIFVINAKKGSGQSFTFNPFSNYPHQSGRLVLSWKEKPLESEIELAFNLCVTYSAYKDRFIELASEYFIDHMDGEFNQLKLMDVFFSIIKEKPTKDKGDEVFIDQIVHVLDRCLAFSSLKAYIAKRSVSNMSASTPVAAVVDDKHDGVPLKLNKK